MRTTTFLETAADTEARAVPALTMPRGYASVKSDDVPRPLSERECRLILTVMVLGATLLVWFTTSDFGRGLLGW